MATDLSSAGFGQGTAVTRGWTNATGYDAAGFDGNGVVTGQLPYLRTDGTDVLAALGCGQAEYFDGFSFGGESYAPRHMSKTRSITTRPPRSLPWSRRRDRSSCSTTFTRASPTYQKGQIKTITDANGNVTTVTSRTSDGKPQEIQRTSTVGGTTTTETFLYAYIASGTNAGKVESVTLQRHVGSGSPTVIRKSEYSYYTGTESAGSDHGTAGDLKLAVIKDGSNQILDQRDYRYRKEVTSSGFAGSLKYAVTGDSYERLKAADSTPEDAPDTLVASMADDYLEFDTLKSVTKHVVQGTGCTACAGGLGESNLAYSTSPFADGYNSWQTKTVETRADGNTLTIYTNFAGQPILEVFKDTTSKSEWLTFHKYDSAGPLVLVAYPSAVSGYDETKADLLNNQSRQLPVPAQFAGADRDDQLTTPRPRRPRRRRAASTAT